MSERGSVRLEPVDALDTLLYNAGHCTGWKAVNTIVSRLPHACIQSNGGTRLHFGGDQ